MTKSELKTGMIVVFADGREYMVYKGIKTALTMKNAYDVIVSTDGSKSWETLSSYNEDLTMINRSCNDMDIVKVIQIPHPYALITPNYDRDGRRVLWKRQEKRKYTYAQLREILGEEFEVVG